MSTSTLFRFSARRCVVFALVALLTALLPQLARAQGRATVFGTVTDPSGAALPGAQVSLLNTDTNQTQSAVTSNNGNYVIPQINPGHFSLTIEAPGFDKFVSRNITVQVDENRQVSAQMKVGTVSTEVVVSGEGAQVDTREATITEVVDAERVKDLPLNGRNPLDLQTLVAGAGSQTNLSGQQQNQLISINGGRYNANNYTLDGVDNEDPFFNSPSVVPNPDALDQFSIKTTNYGAQEGRGDGAQINAITKSGTNQFHGVLFEYFRNSVFDAKPYFSGPTSAVPPYHRNQFGGAVGGRLIRDKLFFFFSYQATRTIANPNALNLIVPSVAERTGNFAELCPAGFSPTTHLCMSAAAGNKQLTFPGTTTKAPNNDLSAYAYAPSLAFLNALVPLPNAPNNTYTYTPHTYANDSQYILRVDATLGAHDTFFVHGIWAPTKDLADQTPALDLPGFLQNVTYRDWHVAANETHTFNMNFVNVATFGYNFIVRHQDPVVPGDASWAGFGSGIIKADAGGPIGFDTKVPTYFNAFAAWPLDQYRHEYQYSDLATWTHKGHTIYFGGDLRQNDTFQQQYFQGDAQVLFAASYTGNQLSDFLVGRPNQVTEKSMNAGEPKNLAPDLFVQDDWKITRRLTLNLGVRWEPWVAAIDKFGRVSQYRAGQKSTVFPNAPAGVVFYGDTGVPAATFPNRWAQFAPRVGFAWDVFGNGKTSLRAGAGIYYASIRTQAFNAESANQPYGYSIIISKPTGGLANPYTSLGSVPFPFVQPSASAAASYTFTLPVSINDFAPDFRGSHTDQFNVNVQQELPGHFVSTIAYVGNVGEHLFMLYDANPGVYSLHGARALAPTFSSIQRYTSGAHSTYHGLQGTIGRRLTKGFSLLASYTWSKSLDNATVETTQMANPFNFSDNRGPSDVDLRHVFAMSALVQLRNWHNHFADFFLGGWQLGTIWKIQSGANFTVLSGVDNSQSAVNQDRADQVGLARTFPHASRTQQIQQYFDTSAFTVNAPGTFGSSGRNELVGPGSDLVDMALAKKLIGYEYYSLHLRAEFFNVLNHPTLNNPVANITSPQNGKISGAGAPRIGQVALRFEF